MKRLRAAVIGCGAIGHNCHLPGYKKNPHCELVAVADPLLKNLRLARKKFSVERGYRDALEMLEKEKPDVVSIGSPNVFHAEQAIAALKQGCHVLCEKPLCMNMEEAKAIQKAARKTGTVFMVAFTHRLLHGNVKTKRALEAGKIGKPFMIRLRFAHMGPDAGWAMSDWFFTPDRAGGGALFDMGIHAIDLASFYMGPIAKVNGMIGTLAKKIELDDNAILQFEFASGDLGYAEVGWTTRQGFSGIEIYGSEGALIVDYNTTAYLVRGSTSASGKRVVRTTTIEKNPAGGGWEIEIDHFIKAVRKNQQPEMGLEAGMASLKVALGAYESAEKGKTVRIR